MVDGPILFFVLEEGEGGESWRANMIAFQVIYKISTNADCDVLSPGLPNYLIDYVVYKGRPASLYRSL